MRKEKYFRGSRARETIPKENYKNKHLKIGPKGNNEFCFPGNIEGLGGAKLIFPLVPVIKGLVIPPNLENGPSYDKNISTTPAARPYHVLGESCCFPTELVSFDP